MRSGSKIKTDRGGLRLHFTSIYVYIIQELIYLVSERVTGGFGGRFLAILATGIYAR